MEFYQHYTQRRVFNKFNVIGFNTLFFKEIKRFINVYFQTVVAPVITSLLFILVFTLALGRNLNYILGVEYIVFLTPGLIVMNMAINSFANTSSSLMISKMQGNIVDVLMAPLNSFEFVSAYILAAAVRGLMIGTFALICTMTFIPMTFDYIQYSVAFGFLGGIMLGLMGFIGGIWSVKFDHIAAVTNFFITPLSFLSGTFYSIERLPEFFKALALFNPFFYMIDGFRYGLIGNSDANPHIGLLFLFIFDMILFFIAWRMVYIGYRIKT